MKRSTIVIVVLTVLGIAEVALLGWVGSKVGVPALLIILILQAALGAWLTWREGGKAWASLRDARHDPIRMGPALSDAGLVMAGGVLFMVPGFISDVLGALFLIPGTRPWAKKGLVGIFDALTRPYRDTAGLVRAKAEPSTVVEGEAVADPPRPGQQPRRDDPGVVRGSIEP